MLFVSRFFRLGRAEDMDAMDPIPGQQTNLKKSKSLGSSLKKLFKGKRGKHPKAGPGENHSPISLSFIHFIYSIPLGIVHDNKIQRNPHVTIPVCLSKITQL